LPAASNREKWFSNAGATRGSLLNSLFQDAFSAVRQNYRSCSQGEAFHHPPSGGSCFAGAPVAGGRIDAGTGRRAAAGMMGRRYKASLC